MAVTTFATNDPLTNKVFSKKLAVESIRHTWSAQFMGTSPHSMIQVKNELTKNAGDQITCGLRVKLNGAGVTGGNVQEGNEERITFHDDAITINKLRHAVRVKAEGTAEQQRVPFELRNEGLDLMAQFWAERHDRWAANQLVGNLANGDGSNGNDVRYTGLQASVAPSASHTLRFASDTDDSDVATDGTAEFRLEHIDVMVETAKNLSPLIRPIKIGGRDWYLCFVHTNVVTQLRRTTSANGLTWGDIQKATLQGGEIDNNPIFTGALGVHNQTILHEWGRLPPGSVGATVAADTRRCLFAGAQAAWAAFGMGHGMGRYQWVEKLFDYDEELGISAGCIGGLKKARFNSTDFATIVQTVGAPANTTLAATS